VRKDLVRATQSPGDRLEPKNNGEAKKTDDCARSAMSRPALGVADIIRAHGAEYIDVYGAGMSPAQRRVLDDLGSCRTSLLGGHVYRCAEFGDEQTAYNSCRNRHCPVCLAHRSAQWLEARSRELLPTPYFHVVFTVPKPIAELGLGNKRVVYDILFKSAMRTLRTIAADPKHLGARIGGMMVLHLWNQQLLAHPHVHCVIPGGGLSPDGRWIWARPKFFLPVSVLSAYFRGAFLAALIRARARGQLLFGGATSALANDRSFVSWVAALAKKEWVVYAKRPFGSPQRVLKYLAQYTHRVAISNRRLVALEDGRVSFRYRDAKRGDSIRVMTISALEFLRRFLLHVHPKRFVRIRHFGFLAARDRGEHLKKCRELLGTPVLNLAEVQREEPSEPSEVNERERSEERRCPSCGSTHLVCAGTIPCGTPIGAYRVIWLDTS
jgi:hypothetical protein